MAEFKVGDRVRLTGLGTLFGDYSENPELGHVVGNTGTVDVLYGPHLGVVTDNAEEPVDPSGTGWFFRADCVEHLEPGA